MDNKQIVGVQFEDKYRPGTYSGRVYSYYAGALLKKGDVVRVPAKNGEGIAQVVRLDVPESEIAAFKDAVKTITESPIDTTIPRGPVRIENWSVVTDDGNAYSAPELQIKRLTGQTYGHLRFDDGKMIKTSRLMHIDIKAKYAKASHTTYQLGEINPSYAAWCNENGINL